MYGPFQASSSDAINCSTPHDVIDDTHGSSLTDMPPHGVVSSQNDHAMVQSFIEPVFHGFGDSFAPSYSIDGGFADLQDGRHAYHSLDDGAALLDDALTSLASVNDDAVFAEVSYRLSS